MTILFWIVGILGGLAALGLLLHVIGTFLPVEHVIGRSVRLRQSPETVWGVITDYANVPSWHPHVKKAEALSDPTGAESWQEWHKGCGVPLRLTTTECLPPRRLVRTIDDGQQFFRGRWEFDLTPDGLGSRLTITEHGEILKPFVRALARLCFNPAMYLDKYLKALAQKFNEAPAIESASTPPELGAPLARM